MIETQNKKLVIVSIADVALSADSDSMLVTYSLGSCLGVSIYDPVARIGALVHCMLPLSKIDSEKARINPWMFIDTGIPAMFSAAYKLGLKKNRVILKVAGGARILDANGRFNIGKRNYTVLRKILWKNNILIESENIGGSCSRTMYLDVGTGRVGLKVNGKIKDL